MKLIIIRHGQTVDNVNKIVQGHLPGKLTKLGIEQAQKLAVRLKDEKIDFIYSSDLTRAVDTANIVAQYHKDTPLIFSRDLREKNQGSFQGKYGPDLDWENPPNDMETLDQIHKRAKRVIDEFYEKHANDTTLFSTHGRFKMALQSIIFDKDVMGMDGLDTPGNTAVTIVEMTEDKEHKIHLLNCVKHLE
jgi:broad specificity phosphatase PhoE